MLSNQIEESESDMHEGEPWSSSLTEQSLPLFLEQSNCPSNELIKCSFCEAELSDELALQEHIELLHAVKKCPVCEETVETMKKLEKHIVANHKGFKPYKCSECDTVFSYRHSLKVDKSQNNTYIV